MKKIISNEITKTIDNLTAVLKNEELIDLIEKITQVCVAAFKRGNKILLVGNGGSAADAQHIAAEFVSRFAFDRPGLPAFALTTDTSVLTAIGNDYSYEKVFARQVQAVGTSGDVLFAISTSGRSANILAALTAAKSKEIFTVGLTGSNGNEMQKLCDYCICIPSTETSKIQEGHIVISHIICMLVEQVLFGEQQ